MPSVLPRDGTRAHAARFGRGRVVSDLTCPNASAPADGVGVARHEAIVAINPACDRKALAERSRT